MKRNLLLLLVSLLPLVASAYDAEIGGIYYKFWGEEAEVTRGDTKYSGFVLIPAFVTPPDGTIYSSKTYKVTRIGSSTFSRCSGLTDVYCLADNVPSTNYYAFEYSPIASATLHVPASHSSRGEGLFMRM